MKDKHLIKWLGIRWINKNHLLSYIPAISILKYDFKHYLHGGLKGYIIRKKALRNTHDLYKDNCNTVLRDLKRNLEQWSLGLYSREEDRKIKVSKSPRIKSKNDAIPIPIPI